MNSVIQSNSYVDYLTHRQSSTLDDSPDSFLGGDGLDLREQDQRMLNPSCLDDQAAIAKVVAMSEIKWIADVAAGGLENLKVGEEYQDVIDEEGRCSTSRCVFDPGGDNSLTLLFAALFTVSWFPP